MARKTPTVLSAASHEWATRPPDNRFLSLIAMRDKMYDWKSQSRQGVVNVKELRAKAFGEHNMEIISPDGSRVKPTNWSTNQLCNRIGAPHQYIAKLDAPLAAMCINYGLERYPTEKALALVRYGEKEGDDHLTALTGENYGRIWNHDLVEAMIDKYGDGVTGDWRIPGEFGKAVVPTIENTTLYASDRDMFIFLADETNRIEIPGKIAGRHKTFARGFFAFNSEVGNGSIGGDFFLFDYACCNRNVWGVGEYTSVRMRHTSGAPNRWAGEIEPVLKAYSMAKVGPWIAGIKAAMTHKLDDPRKFLAIDMKLGPKMTEQVWATHVKEEQRPIESLWDASVGITAHAKTISHMDNRLRLETIGGNILSKALAKAA